MSMFIGIGLSWFGLHFVAMGQTIFPQSLAPFPPASDQLSPSFNFSKDGQSIDMAFRNRLVRSEIETSKSVSAFNLSRGHGSSWSEFRACQDGEHFAWWTNSSELEIRSRKDGTLVKEARGDFLLDASTEGGLIYLTKGKSDITMNRLGQEKKLWKKAFPGKRVVSAISTPQDDVFIICLLEEPGNQPWTGGQNWMLIRGLEKPDFIPLEGLIARDNHHRFLDEGKLLKARLSNEGRKAIDGIWSLETGKLLRKEPLQKPEFWPRSFLAEEDGYRILKNEDRLEIENVKTGELVFQSPRLGVNARLKGMKFSPDGSYLACSVGCSVRVWRTRDWAEVGGHIGKAGHLTPVISHAWSADGKCFATGELAGRVILWNARTHEKIWEIEDDRYTWGVEHLSFTPDSQKLARFSKTVTGPSRSGWHFHDVTNGEEQFVVEGIVSKTPPVFSRKKNRFYGYSLKEGIQEWDLDKGELVKSFPFRWREQTDQILTGMQWSLSGEKSLWLYGEYGARTRFDFEKSGEKPITDAWEAVSGKLEGDTLAKLRERTAYVDPTTAFPQNRSVWPRETSQKEIVDLLGGRLLLQKGQGGLEVRDIYEQESLADHLPLMEADAVFSRWSGSFTPDGQSIWWGDARGMRAQGFWWSSFRVKDRTIDELWELLGYKGAKLPTHVLFTMAARDDAENFLAQKMKRMASPDPRVLSFLRTQVSDGEIAVRMAAARALLDFGETLTEGEEARLTPKSRFEIAAVIRGGQPIEGLDFKNESSSPLPLLPLSNRDRLSRALLVLELRGTAEARAIIEEMAKGDGQSPITQEARLALLRMAKGN